MKAYRDIMEGYVSAPVYVIDWYDMLPLPTLPNGNAHLPYPFVLFSFSSSGPFAMKPTDDGDVFMRLVASYRTKATPGADHSISMMPFWWRPEWKKADVWGKGWNPAKGNVILSFAGGAFKDYRVVPPEVATAKDADLAKAMLCALHVAVDHPSRTGVVPASRRSLSKAYGLHGWTYHVVDVPKVAIARPPPKGGTHASPRWHMRRAHWRRTATGKVWVSECSVGSAAHGGVLHDYKA